MTIADSLSACIRMSLGGENRARLYGITCLGRILSGCSGLPPIPGSTPVPWAPLALDYEGSRYLWTVIKDAIPQLIETAIDSSNWHVDARGPAFQLATDLMYTPSGKSSKFWHTSALSNGYPRCLTSLEGNQRRSSEPHTDGIGPNMGYRSGLPTAGGFHRDSQR